MATASKGTVICTVADPDPLTEEPQSSEANSIRLRNLCIHRKQDLHQETIAVIGMNTLLGLHNVASLLRTCFRSNIFCTNRLLDGEQRTMLAVESICVDHTCSLAHLHLVTDIAELNMGVEQGDLLASEVDEVVFFDRGLPLRSLNPLLDAIRCSSQADIRCSTGIDANEKSRGAIGT
jgi:hypothetical protein